MERDLTRQEHEYRRAVMERSRRERWATPGTAKVTHPAHGSVVVPHRSNYAALLNAAEVWGCGWMEIRDATVLAAAPGEPPVPMPTLLNKGGARNVRKERALQSAKKHLPARL